MKLTEKQYRTGMILPIVLLIFSLGVLGNAYLSGEVLERDIDLKGGVQITLSYTEKVDVPALEAHLKSKLVTSDIRIRTNSDPTTREQLGLQIEAGVLDTDKLESEIGKYLGIKLTDKNRSITNFESSLAESFWRQGQKAVIFAVIFMSVIIVFSFKKPILFGTILLNVFADLLTTVAIMSLFGVRLSLAAIAALLMILGYGVDSNILLCTRALKERTGSRLDRINETLKTGITMSATTIAPLTAILFFARAPALKTISLVLIIGLLADFIYTWFVNVNILLRIKK